MPRPRVYKEQAIVLRQRKLGEADKIVTLYTAHKGKVDAVAKGVRRTKSRLAGHLEPLTHGAYLLAEGRELDIVTQAETVEAYAALREDLERLSRGLYCAELVERLTPERSEGNPIFRLLAETLGYLDSTPDYELAVRRFELRLLSELGYRPSLGECAVCGKRLEPEQNFWSVDAGGGVCPACADDSLRLAPLSLNALKLLRLLQRAPFEEVTRVRVSGVLGAELETCLGDYVRYVLEREVRSARFVETLRQTRVGGSTPA
jgi:DNA repair protein RecO (recombination protein O)